MPTIKDILTMMVEKKASDIHFRVGTSPIFRINGELAPSSFPKLNAGAIEKVAHEFLSESKEKIDKFRTEKEMDLAYTLDDVGRFRVNIFYSVGNYGIVVRHVPFQIPSFEELNLPTVLKKISLYERGLILVTGTTGSGKSTSLAAMIDYINTHRHRHIVTIEDPIEFIHDNKLSTMTQREVGLDTMNFPNALKHVLRQDPDVILIGEMRDQETVGAAITAAETGHLVFGTLHTLDAVQTINRIIDFFPPHHQAQVRVQLSFTLKAVISMRLLQRIDIKARIPALEIMISNANIKELIQDQKRTHEIVDAIKEGSQYGMVSFDQFLYDLLQEKKISYEEALQHATNPSDFELSVKGFKTQADLKKAESTEEQVKQKEAMTDKLDFSDWSPE